MKVIGPVCSIIGILGIGFAVTPGFASELLSPVEPGLAEVDSMAQVTSISQLSDVQPTDWAFQALQALVERYGCIAGYPDGTFQGNRTLTRFEFAAGLNACLDRINERLAIPTNEEFVSQDDLEILERLQVEFSAELTTIRDRINTLEPRIAELEANQFSPTTKLSGLTIVGVQARTPNRADLYPRDGERETEDEGTSANVIHLTQLYLTTSFSDRSYLLTGLLISDGTSAPRLTNDVRLGYELFNSDNVILSDLNYRFLVTDNFAAIAGIRGVNMVYAFRGPNRVESAASGPLSVFAQRNPILNMNFGSGGVGFDWQFAKRASLQAVYSTTLPGDPKEGLFGGYTAASAQLLLTPVDPVDIALYYVYAYSPDGALITVVGDDQLTADNPITGNSAPLRTHAVGATVNWQISPRVVVGGWGGYTYSFIPGESGSVQTTNYMVYLNFPDLFGEGNLGGIYVGQPPKIISSDLPLGNNVPDTFDTGLGREGGQPGTTLHVEAFYRWQITDNISLTPGAIIIFQPGHTPDSDPIAIGALRTTFAF